jgi:hypothetical protein
MKLIDQVRVVIRKKHDRSGHLFQGRYKAILVEVCKGVPS